MKRRLFIALFLGLNIIICLCILSCSENNHYSSSSQTPTIIATSSPTDSLITCTPSTEAPVSASPVPTSTPSPSPSPQTARIVMIGDMLMHDGVINSGLSNGKYNFDHLFTNISEEILGADIAIVNQEVIIAGPDYEISGYPRFNSPLELANSISKAGFDIVLHASNHPLDKGKDAALYCLSYWQSNFPHIDVLGIHETEEDAKEITVREINGIKLAFLNYTFDVNASLKPILQQTPYLVDTLNEEKVRRDIANAELLADATIVAVHWGTEYTHKVSDYQQKWAKIFLECGVDLVLGTHPHVIQPVEWLESSDGHRMLVYWSLGNFVNCTSGRGRGKGARMLGAMSDVTFTKNEKGATTISTAVAHSLITHIDYSEYGITTYLFNEYTQELFSQNKTKEIDPDFSYQFCVNTFETVLGDFLAVSP